MTQWAKNELTASRRECDLIVFADGGGLAPRGTNFIALGIGFVRGVNTPALDLATGTFTNNRIPVTLAPFTYAVNTGTSTTNLVAAAHGLQNGDGPIRLTSTGAPPTGLALATDYYVILVDANTFKLATSLANAYAGVAVVMSTNGTGVNQITGVGTTPQRGLDGRFTYQATQAETNHNHAETAIVIEGAGYSLANGGGGAAYVMMGSAVQGFESICEGSMTYGDAQRLQNSILAGPVLDFTTNTLVFKSLDGTKTRWTVTVSAAGRLTPTPGDLT